MRAKFNNEFERRFCKAARKHCDHIYTLGESYIGYWQYVYKCETVFGVLDVYDKMVEDKKIKPFPESVIDEYIGAT